MMRVYTDTDELCPLAECQGPLQFVEHESDYATQWDDIPTPPYYECSRCLAQWDLGLMPLPL